MLLKELFDSWVKKQIDRQEEKQGAQVKASYNGWGQSDGGMVCTANREDGEKWTNRRYILEVE